MKSALTFSCLLVFATQVRAISIVYETEATFLGAIDAGYYLNEFDSITSYGDLGESLSFSGGNYAYTVTSPGGGLYGVPQFPDPNWALSTWNYDNPLFVSFTNSNVTAVGGLFSLTNTLGYEVGGSVKVVLSDGTTREFDVGSFRGFTSDGATITSLTLSTEKENAFATMDHFYVGAAVPDGGTTLVLLGGALTGLGLLRRRFCG